jgi:aconitase B
VSFNANSESVKVTFKGDGYLYGFPCGTCYSVSNVETIWRRNVFQGQVLKCIGYADCRSSFYFTDWTAEMKAKASISEKMKL